MRDKSDDLTLSFRDNQICKFLVYKIKNNASLLLYHNTALYRLCRNKNCLLLHKNTMITNETYFQCIFIEHENFAEFHSISELLTNAGSRNISHFT